jgi:hypothetical protein
MRNCCHDLLFRITGITAGTRQTCNLASVLPLTDRRTAITWAGCVGKKAHLARRLIATHQSNPCAPLSDVVRIHEVKTREQSLRLLE